MADEGRVDAKKFNQAVEQSLKDLETVEERLAKFITMLTPEERKRFVKGRPDVIEAAEGLADRASKHPGILAATGFEADAVKEDCTNLKALARLEEKLSAIQKRVADGRLSWEAEVMVPTLDFYAASKRPSKDDAELALTINPLKVLLASPREAKKKNPEG
jgi:hypothetical protein